MNENLDLTKILDGCPKGIEFYSTVYGEVRFVELDDSNVLCPILMENDFTGQWLRYAKDGRSVYNCGECTLFPSKDQRDWSKFERFWDNNPKVEKFDPNTLQLFDKILVRDCPDELWSIEFFSHKTGNIVRGLCSNWIYAIPFNEETKHLANKREDCPEYYKWWEK